MNDSHDSDNIPESGSPEERRSALFAHMVMQQSSMAMMLMGKAAHPETGKVVCDLEAARFFIDQLEMLEFKTKGNLNQEEAALLKQSLMSLRMAYVESADSPPAPPESREQESAAGEATTGAGPNDPAKTPSISPGAEESRKKFTKKY
jgi:cell division septation protein DedD